jgi:hypothetical protein
MITIQQLHAYKKLSNAGIIPALTCPIDINHEEIFPWVDENDEIYLWCIFCNSKVHLGIERQKYIMGLLGQ